MITPILLATLLAQAGDKPGEAQPPPTVAAPPAPVLSPAEALRSLQVADGLEVTLVAAEPLVVDPVCMAFGPDGRLWVVEMRAFMPNVDGEGEEEPIGRVVTLSDSDGNGVFDRSTVFLDELVLPRAVAPLLDGALIIAPPNLLLARDSNGDGQADDVRVLLDGFGGIASPEHAGNGLVRGIDNWHHLSQHGLDVRLRGDELQTRRIPTRGQWGIGQDATGRLYTTPNSIPLLVDHLPPHYSARSRRMKGAAGAGQRVSTTHAVHPIRVNPGVNRAYREGHLREDGTLTNFDAACGTSIYVGAALAGVNGDAIICEPAGNLVKRKSFETGRYDQAFDPLGTGELLASTDERFRPTWSLSGPDGAIYICDMYRGILQHRLFVTTFLRKQILERGLDQPLGLGRIWRIAPRGRRLDPIPDLSAMTDGGLVRRLVHPDGAVRLLAQQVLVERGSTDTADALRSLLRHETWTARLHALWTLEGLDALSQEDALVVLNDPHPALRAAALRLLEPWLDEPQVLEAMRGLLGEQDRGVQLQLAASLGEAHGSNAMALLAAASLAWAADAVLREAVVSGLAGRESRFIDVLTSDPAFDIAADGCDELVQLLIETAPPPDNAGGVELDAAALSQFDRGALVYAVCAACHQADGLGLPGKYPPIANSPIVTGDPETLAKVLLHGVAGEITVLDQTFDDTMPPSPLRRIEDIAAVMTYVRNAFGNSASPVDAEFVRRVRAANRNRTHPWSVRELLGTSDGH